MQNAKWSVIYSDKLSVVNNDLSILISGHDKL
jgi:hypothetical protein